MQCVCAICFRVWWSSSVVSYVGTDAGGGGAAHYIFEGGDDNTNEGIDER
jgi:hypothetical protein